MLNGKANSCESLTIDEFDETNNREHTNLESISYFTKNMDPFFKGQSVIASESPKESIRQRLFKIKRKSSNSKNI